MYSPRLLRVGAVLCLVVAGDSADGQTILHLDDDATLGFLAPDLVSSACYGYRSGTFRLGAQKCVDTT